MRHRILLLFLMFSTVLQAQTGMFRGSVRDESNDNPIAYCNIIIYGIGKGAVTDDKGFFSISRIPAGEYKVRVSCVGYDSITTTIRIGKDEIVSRVFRIKPSVHQLSGTIISAERAANLTDVRVAMQYVAPKQIEQLPTVGGIPDLAQYLQVLPGIVSTGDQGGQLYVRGGTPIQNKVLLDGMNIYNPFHSIGLFSIFDTDILKEADVYTAGFHAEYGGRTSSVMDVRTRNGNKKRFGGKADISTFGSKLVLEGPLRKRDMDKKKAASPISFITSIKGSYLEQTSKLLYRYANADGLPYNYLDAYGKITIEPSDNNHINLFGFSFNDQVNYPEIARYHWNAWGIGSNFLVVPSHSEQIIQGVLAYSNYGMGLDEHNEFGRNSGMRDFTFSTNFTYHFDKNTFKYGFDLTGTWVDYNFTNALGVDCGQKTFNSEIAIYTKYKWNLRKWIIEPGLRLDNYASQNATSLEPRFAAKYLMTENIRFKMAAGLYSQNLIGATSDQDVVNLFYGFLTVPETDELSGKKIRNSLQKGQHVVCGMEYDFSRFMTANMEVYYKNFSQLTNINRYQVFESDDEFLLETGRAYGGDITLKFDKDNLYVWTVYSLNWVTRHDGKIRYRTHFDRRHNLNITAAYRWGKNQCWHADLRWNYGSGFPFTMTKAFYPNIINLDDLHTDIIGANETLGTALDDLNQGQMPDYHRLDFTLSRTFIHSDVSRSEIGIGATNLYNYANIFYVSRKTNEKIYQLPFLWSLHWNIRF
ncbi:MAG: TonB-dependent receptor [Bacteroidales bacterium]|nr:TonB-dependent receptor [Bacteroidales bacterium]